MNDDLSRPFDARSRLVEAIDQLAEAVLLRDRSNRLIFANKAALATFAEAAGYLSPGTRFQDFLDSAVRLGLFAHGAWASERVPFYLSLRGSRLLMVREESLPSGDVVAFLSDVIPDSPLDSGHNSAQIQTELADRAKATFIANLSHELRTPLNAILGFSEMMTREVFGPLGAGRYREYAADIAAAARHLLDVVNDVLDLSRLQATGEMPLDIRPVDPPAVAEACRRVVAGMADRAGLALRLETAPGLGTIRADERRIRQVVLNLLGNAIKFTPSGGLVILSVAGSPTGSVEFSVSDTGPGMTESEVRGALARFGQGTPSQRERRHGTGLGLAISRAIVEAHGGSLTVESEPGRGTTVRAQFPPAPPRP